MTGPAEVACQFMIVSRQRGQQLKDPAQLDGSRSATDQPRMSTDCANGRAEMLPSGMARLTFCSAR